LAKELGVQSKVILQKLKDEGLAGQAPTHNSTLSLGLEETVREWFAGHGNVGTAVETAAPIDVVKVAKPRTRKKKVETAEHTPEDPAAHAPPAEPVQVELPEKPAPEVKVEPAAPTAPVEPEKTPVTEPPVVVAPTPVAPIPAPAPAPVKEAPAAKPAIAAQAPAVQAPVQQGPATPTAPVSAPATPASPGKAAAAARPTITLADVRNQQHPRPERKPVTPAPQLLVPQKAVIQGPRVVREEKPDVVPAPRPRRPAGDGPSTGGPGYTTARPATGRGVRKADDEEEEKKAAAKKGAGSLSQRRRGVDGRRGEAMEKLKEFTDADLLERKERLLSAASFRSGFDTHLKKSQARGTHQIAKTAVQKGEAIDLEEPITVKSLSAALGIKSNDIIRKLMSSGVFATVNQALDQDTAAAIAIEYGIEVRLKEKETLEQQLVREFDERREATAPEKLQTRPPVVTILGHVDHGKTSLLDKIRSANVAAGEAGGITQHTASWMVDVEKDGVKKKVTFIDTPGHQAFTAMRARGAHMTDVVVLVVAAVEGVMPQTIESINHARAAGVPIVVAMNKIDRNEAQPDMVLGQLAGQNLNPVEWGGDTEVIRTSATTGQGIPELLETLEYQSELLELKADPTAPARGSVIESRMDPGLGSVATVLVQDGTLKVGDVMLSGPGYGRVRQLFNDRGEPIKEAGPSTPVIVSGLSQLPSAGDKFYVVESVDRAKTIAEERATLSRHEELAQNSRVTLDNLFSTMKEGDIKTINLIVKGDVMGSVETLAKTVNEHNTDEVRVRVIHSAVGGITESDVELADASKAVIIGFNVVPDESARAMAEHRHIEIRLYRVIYEILDDLKKALSGMLEPEIREKLHGHAEIRQVFKVSKLGNIAGCMVTDGHISRGSKIRLIREGTVITEDLTIDTLKRVKEDAKEVKSGFECGIKLHGYDDIKIGDRLEAYIRETFQRTL
jgi:translation initiation factor IF-2